MRIVFAVLCMLIFSSLQGQTYEVGLFAGGANNIGDIGRMNFILPSGPAFGAIFKWNKSKRYAWRASVIQGSFTADDSKSSLQSRSRRGLRMDNSILEASAGLEVNFVEYNLHKTGPAFTPYLYTGITYFRYDFNYFDAGLLIDVNQREGSFAIPMTVGAKLRLNQQLILGAEIGARYTFTDNLDASNPEGSNFEAFRLGNIFSDDWYVFSGITLTYTFGRKPCSDCFEYN
ncbi:type IX secretion system protein PorG [Robiginitalea sp. IMCC43444]|uniref:type IX secretion system protein PorG n=1 Tax=Robiginitalea sp. IMCC43444 TaxID=3459121 RepID=UPI00404120FB